MLSSSLKTPTARGSSRRRGRGAVSPWKRKLTDVFSDLLEDGFLDQHANVPRYTTQKNVLHSRLLVAEISQFQPLPQTISSSAPPRHTCSDTRVKRQTVVRRQRNFQCNVRTHDPPTILIRKKHEDAEFAGTGRPLTFSNNSTHPATQNSHIIYFQNGELCNVTAKIITNTSSYVTVLSCFFWEHNETR